MAKRITFSREFFQAAGRKRWTGLSKEQRSAIARARWAKFTPEERSAEMKRRAKVRTKNRTKKEK